MSSETDARLGNEWPGATTIPSMKHQATPGAAMFRRRDDIQARIWGELARRMGATVERLWKAQGTTGQMVAYMGAILVGKRLDEAVAGSDAAPCASGKAA